MKQLFLCSRSELPTGVPRLDCKQVNLIGSLHLPVQSGAGTGGMEWPQPFASSLDKPTGLNKSCYFLCVP